MIKTLLGGLALFFFTVGFLLVDRSSSGNVVFEANPTIKIASFVGLGLIALSLVITFYLVRKS